tara:strand:- start:9 stop:269 length:261 start_codon:yes stop_codon:yes gene_type:complete
MSHPDPLQEHYAEEILDDRMSRRDQLEQEIEKTERNLADSDQTWERIKAAKFVITRETERNLQRIECKLRETLARLRDELDELDSD